MKKIIIAVLVISLLCPLTCFAANTIRGTYDEATKIVEVTGHLDEYANSPVAVWILKDGKEDLTGITKEAANQYLLHIEQAVTNETGNFTFTYKVNNEGIYNVFAKSFDGTLSADGAIICRGSGYYLELVERIEALTDAENKNNDLDARVDDLKEILAEKGVYDALMIYESDMPAGVKLSEITDGAFKIFLSCKNEYPAKEGELAKVLVDAVVTDIINTAQVSDIEAKLTELKDFLPNGYDLMLKEFSDFKTSNETAYNDISKTLEEKEFNTTDEIALAICESVAVTSLKTMENYSEFMRFVTRVDNQMGLDLEKYNTIVSPRVPSNVDKAMLNAKNNIDTLKDMIDTFSEECDNELTRVLENSTGTSSKGSSGGGSGGSIAGYVSVPIVPEVSEEDIEDAPSEFKDLNQKHWAYIPIANLAKRGIINGYSNGTFAPNNNVKREELVKMLIASFTECDNSAASDFEDVNKSDWHYSYVSTAYSKGYIKGMSDTSFGSGQFVTRQDSAVMIYNIVSKLGKTLPSKRTYTPFGDENNIADYAADAVKALYCAEIVDGTGSGFSPEGNLTRAEAAKIIYGVLKIVKG